MMARYCMYQQVYNHRTRKIYDFHLRQFLKQWLSDGKFPHSAEEYIQLTDIDVWAGIQKAARRQTEPGHEPARRIVKREHFKLAYEHHPKAGNFDNVAKAARSEFEDEFISEQMVDLSAGRKKPDDFPVLEKSGRVLSSGVVSDFPTGGMEPSFGYVFADDKILSKVKEWF